MPKNEYIFYIIVQFIGGRYIWSSYIYSYFPDDHDQFVNFKRGFYYTLNGINNLATTNSRIEIRILLNSITNKRIKQLSSFIFKNLPFINHVAFMGIEVIGNVTLNWNELRIDSMKYLNYIEESIDFLSRWNIRVSIYNIPLCNLPLKLYQEIYQN